jgi:hypothetical protein
LLRSGDGGRSDEGRDDGQRGKAGDHAHAGPLARTART